MIEDLRLQMKIWRLEWAYAAKKRGSDKAVERAKARGAPFDEIEEIMEGNHSFIQQHRQRIHEAHSSYVLAEADRLIIPVPDDMWEHDVPGLGLPYLKRTGLKSYAQSLTQIFTWRTWALAR